MQIWLNSHSGKQNPNQVLCQSISCSIDRTHSPHTRSALQFLPAWRAVSDLVEGETRVNVKLTFPFFPFISWNRNSLFSILSCSGVKWFVSHKNTQSHTEMWNSELKAATGCCCRGECSLLLTTATKTAESHQSLRQSLQAKRVFNPFPSTVQGQPALPSSFHRLSFRTTHHCVPLCMLWLCQLTATKVGQCLNEHLKPRKTVEFTDWEKEKKKHGVCWTLFIVPPLFVLFSLR